MSNTESITFRCPECGVQLSVPVAIIDVTGPCPSCRAIIQAPQPEPSPPPAPEAPEEKADLPTEEVVGDRADEPSSQLNEIPPPPTEAATSAPPDATIADSPEIILPVPKEQASKTVFLAFGIAVVLLALLLGAFFLRDQRIPPETGVQNKPEPFRIVIEKIAKPVILPEAATQPLPMEEIEEIEVAPKPVTGFSEIDPAIEAREVLENFLSAKNLQDRLPLIESSLDQGQLEQSLLTRPFLEVASITVDLIETHPSRDIVNHFYYVDFLRPDGTLQPYTMLVTSQGNSAPKVKVDPFLDLYGGRLADYASRPANDPRNFQVIISAGAYCSAYIPNAEEKFTLKILPRDDSQEIATAFFRKDSSIADMLRDGTSGLYFGQPKTATILLGWNTEENPDQPYLEAKKIISLDWNP